MDGHVNKRLSSENALKQEFFLGPSQFLRQLKKHKGDRKKKVSTSVFYTQLDSGESSPARKLSPSIAHKNSEQQSPLTPKSQDSIPISPNSILISPEPSSMSQDSILIPSKEFSLTVSSDSSSVTPVTSYSDMDTLFQHHITNSSQSHDSMNEVDFAAPAPEKNQLSPVSTRKLIRSLDLSSNLLTSLQELCHGQGSGLVLQRLKELRKLDLKQNRIEGLPRELMQVPPHTLCI